MVHYLEGSGLFRQQGSCPSRHFPTTELSQEKLWRSRVRFKSASAPFPAGYDARRRLRGLSQPRNLARLSPVLQNPALARKFLHLYGTPDNTDIWTGAIAEPLSPGARAGPLLACLFENQFTRTRKGDR